MKSNAEEQYVMINQKRVCLSIALTELTVGNGNEVKKFGQGL